MSSWKSTGWGLTSWKVLWILIQLPLLKRGLFTSDHALFLAVGGQPQPQDGEEGLISSPAPDYPS